MLLTVTIYEVTRPDTGAVLTESKSLAAADRTAQWLRMRMRAGDIVPVELTVTPVKTQREFTDPAAALAAGYELELHVLDAEKNPIAVVDGARVQTVQTVQAVATAPDLLPLPTPRITP